MAETVVLPGTGQPVTVDDCGADGNVQIIKLAYSADGVATHVTADANGLLVNSGPQTLRIAVTSAGLTTASTTYTAGDQEGTEMTFANAARATGQGGVVVSAVLLDKPKVLSGTPAEMDLLLFSGSVTGAADNSPFDDSDADMAKYLGRIKFYAADWMSQASNAVNERHGLSIGYTCDATSLFGIFVGRTNHNFYSAVTDLVISLVVVRD